MHNSDDCEHLAVRSESSKNSAITSPSNASRNQALTSFTSCNVTPCRTGMRLGLLSRVPSSRCVQNQHGDTRQLPFDAGDQPEVVRRSAGNGNRIHGICCSDVERAKLFGYWLRPIVDRGKGKP